MLTLMLALGSFICFAMPFAGLIALARRGKKPSVPFWIGAAAFIVSQLFIRIPILQLLGLYWPYMSVLQLYPLWYSLFLGVSAGVFECAARFIALRYILKRRRSFCDGLAYGLGHGGVEAILLVGVNYLVALITGVGVAEATPGLIALGTAERVIAMLIHISVSLMVLYGIAIGKPWTWLIIATALHALVDTLTSYLALTGAAVWVIELAILAMTLPMAAYAWKLRGRFPVRDAQ